MSKPQFSTADTNQPHPLAGTTVKATTTHPLYGQSETTVDFSVEDYWHRVAGKSWMFSDGNPACIAYAIRTAGLTPIDDEVLYGKTPDGSGHLVHVSEIADGSEAR